MCCQGDPAQLTDPPFDTDLPTTYTEVHLVHFLAIIQISDKSHYNSGTKISKSHVTVGRGSKMALSNGKVSVHTLREGITNRVHLERIPKL